MVLPGSAQVIFLVVIPAVHLPPTSFIVQTYLRRAMASTSFQEPGGTTSAASIESSSAPAHRVAFVSLAEPKPKPLIRRIRCAF